MPIEETLSPCCRATPILFIFIFHIFLLSTDWLIEVQWEYVEVKNDLLKSLRIS